jgi:hypothetical protein
MFILIKPKPISNKTRVYLVSSYRDADGIPHHKIIKSYGSYQALMAKDHRIIEKLKRQAKEYVADNNQNKKIVIDTAKPSE